MNSNLLTVKGLKKYFDTRVGFLKKPAFVHAVDGVDLNVGYKDVLGLVGESGCGKSTLGRSILRLIEPTSGEIIFDGEDMMKVDNRRLRALRRKMQIIFQDPFSSLNPRKRVIDTVGEPFIIHGIAKGKALKEQVVSILEKVGLSSDSLYRYPHEFSGGQRQRIGIARALAVEPVFIVADEPLSALDVSIQAQIINLLQELQTSLGISFLFISHDLKVVRHFSERVTVMYLGIIVEMGRTEEIFTNPQHPYTEALLTAIPMPDPSKKRKKIILAGDVPNPAQIPPGCRFHPRCPKRIEPCDRIRPKTTDLGGGHLVECHLRG
ncbi:MAG: ATP-binding cassette domain-containing protein [Nitrospirae bacterium]|nr:ATP-binding cassette domain-containing protein [Nitrospirota bacterium]